MHLEELRHQFWGSFFSEWYSVIFDGLVWFLFGFCRDLCFTSVVCFPLPPLSSVARSICFRARFGVTKFVTDRVF